jgi:hypothetical protein
MTIYLEYVNINLQQQQQHLKTQSFHIEQVLMKRQLFSLIVGDGPPLLYPLRSHISQVLQIDCRFIGFVSCQHEPHRTISPIPRRGTFARDVGHCGPDHLNWQLMHKVLIIVVATTFSKKIGQCILVNSKLLQHLTTGLDTFTPWLRSWIESTVVFGSVCFTQSFHLGVYPQK